MNRRGQVQIKAGPVAAALIVLVIVSITWVTPKVRSWYEERRKAQAKQLSYEASASADFAHSLTVAGDPWSGYFIFRSAKFRALMDHAKIRYKYETEEDLGKRFAGLAEGKYDAVVATVDGYTLNGHSHGYPGVISWVIDESYGGDAIVGGPKLQSLDDFETLADLPRVAFAEAYPSEHLLNAMLIQFHKQVKKVPVKSSSAALELLKQGQVDAAVLWEPETSEAAVQVPGSKVLISTRDMVDFIVDVAVVSRQRIVEKPELVEELCNAYFSSLKYYEANPAKLVEDIAADAGVPETVGKKIAAGIRFVNLADNGFHWFGVGAPEAREKMSRIIQETVNIQKDQLPPGTLEDPFYVLNRSVLERALAQASSSPLAKKFKVAPTAPKATPATVKDFRTLSEVEWDAAKPIGTLDVAPIYFSSGSADFGARDRQLIDDVAAKLGHYPNLRLKIVGHTSPGSDVTASRDLSLQRARAVSAYLVSSHGLLTNRVHATGVGGDEPLPRKPGEPDRAWRSRTQRVEFILVDVP